MASYASQMRERERNYEPQSKSLDRNIFLSKQQREDAKELKEKIKKAKPKSFDESEKSDKDGDSKESKKRGADKDLEEISSPIKKARKSLESGHEKIEGGLKLSDKQKADKSLDIPSSKFALPLKSPGDALAAYAPQKPPETSSGVVYQTGTQPPPVMPVAPAPVAAPSAPDNLAMLNQAQVSKTGGGNTFGVPSSFASYGDKLKQVESAGKWDAQNRLSSAYGGYQITKPTFDLIRKKDPNLKDITWEQFQKEPNIQTAFAHSLTQMNDSGLKASGHELNDRNRYIAHFAGSAGAKKILSADPNAKLGEVLGEAAARANPTLANKTVAQFNQYVDQRFAKATPGGAPGVPGAVPSDVAMASAAAPPAPPPVAQQRTLTAGLTPTTDRILANPNAIPGQVDSNTLRAIYAGKQRERQQQMLAMNSNAPTMQAASGGLVESYAGGGGIDPDRPWEAFKGNPDKPWEAYAQASSSEQTKTAAPKVPQKPMGEDSGTNRAWRALRGGAQGALVDPVLSIAQLLPSETTNQWAREKEDAYQDWRRAHGGEGFDFARTAGSIVPIGGAAGLALKGAAAVSKGAKVAKALDASGDVIQGVTQGPKSLGSIGRGAVAGTTGGFLTPVESLDEFGKAKDINLTDKITQVGSGALLGGGAGALIGKTANMAKNQFTRGLNKESDELSASLKAAGKTDEEIAVSIDKFKDDKFKTFYKDTPGGAVEHYKDKYGSDAFLTPGMSANALAKGTENVAAKLPFVESFIKGRQSEALADWNKALLNNSLKKVGSELPKGSTPTDMYSSAFKVYNEKYNSLLKDAYVADPKGIQKDLFGTAKINKATGEIDRGVIGDSFDNLGDLEKVEAKRLLDKYFFDRFGTAGKGGSKTAPLSGEKFKIGEEGLKKVIKQFNEAGGDKRTMAGVLDDALKAIKVRHLKSDDVSVGQSLNNLNRGYAELATLAKAAGSKTAGDNAIIFGPATLQRISEKPLIRAKGTGGLFSEDVRLAKNVFGDTTPDSGTAQGLLAAQLAGNVGKAAFTGGTLLGGAAATPWIFGAAPIAAAYTKTGSKLIRGTGNLINKARNNRIGEAVANKEALLVPAVPKGGLSAEGVSSPLEEAEQRARGGMIHYDAGGIVNSGVGGFGISNSYLQNKILDAQARQMGIPLQASPQLAQLMQQNQQAMQPPPGQQMMGAPGQNPMQPMPPMQGQQPPQMMASGGLAYGSSGGYTPFSDSLMGRGLADLSVEPKPQAASQEKSNADLIKEFLDKQAAVFAPQGVEQADDWKSKLPKSKAPVTLRDSELASQMSGPYDSNWGEGPYGSQKDMGPYGTREGSWSYGAEAGQNPYGSSSVAPYMQTKKKSKKAKSKEA